MDFNGVSSEVLRFEVEEDCRALLEARPTSSISFSQENEMKASPRQNKVVFVLFILRVIK